LIGSVRQPLSRQSLAALLAAMFCCGVAAAGADLSGFGSGIAPHATQPKAIAIDVDGDGRPDHLYVVRIAAGARLEGGVHTVNPWRPRRMPKDGAALALAIARADGARHLLYDPEFFGTPIWQSAPLPLEAVARGTPRHRQLSKLAAGAKGDLLLLGTEAGIDLVLYWNGRHYLLAFPDETP
jgi:hypothetical protein